MSIISSIRNMISRYVMPRVFLNWSDPNIVLRKREEKEEIRKKEGRPHEVFYFHELLDPYSHITAQLINKFKAEYSVEFVPLVVNEPPSKTVHEPSMYRKYCLTDAIRIAPFYGVEFPSGKLPNDKVVEDIFINQNLAYNMKPKSIHVSLSTISPKLSKKLKVFQNSLNCTDFDNRFKNDFSAKSRL